MKASNVTNKFVSVRNGKNYIKIGREYSIDNFTADKEEISRNLSPPQKPEL